MRSPERGFGIAETLMALFLVGVILGLVARGYQALSRLNLATYQMSQRMELTSLLQRLSYEVAGALSIETLGDSLRFQQIDPTLNLNHEQLPPARLPWPIPQPPPTVDLLGAPYQVLTEYRFEPTEHEILRTIYGETSTVAVDIGEFQPVMDPSDPILTITVRPKEMTASTHARIFLPLVQP